MDGETLIGMAGPCHNRFLNELTVSSSRSRRVMSSSRSRRAPKASAADEALANAAKQKGKSRLDQLEDEDEGDVRCI